VVYTFTVYVSPSVGVKPRSGMLMVMRSPWTTELKSVVNWVSFSYVCTVPSGGEMKMLSAMMAVFPMFRT